MAIIFNKTGCSWLQTLTSEQNPSLIMYKLPLTIKIFDYDADYPTTTSFEFYCVEIVI